jgi:hypothetical protein
MCLNEIYSRIQVGKNLCAKFPIRNGLKQGDALSLLVSNYALDYTIRSVQVNQDGLKLNVAHQLLVYADVYTGTKCTNYKLKHGSFSSC